LLTFCQNISDDTVEVGANLYELDTEAEASMAAPTETAASPSEAAPAPAKEEPAPVVAAASPKPQSQHRTPSIAFLGKEGWSRALSGKSEAPVVYAIPPNYGRPKFSEEEMEALMMGGANLAPEVKQHSAGAVFGF
jgi:pyruvate/2-oxoglutarate dehydrogenase complex dihydrolipoamide acyltransferase (E2) component